MGENTPEALMQGVNILAGATYDTLFIGIALAAGVDSPAGQVGDIIYWKAGSSFANIPG
jgi:hypothetical protein